MVVEQFVCRYLSHPYGANQRVNQTQFARSSFMHSTTPLRVLRVRTSKQVASRRFASHGAPHYNEPSGYLFSEKVMTSVPTLCIN